VDFGRCSCILRHISELMCTGKFALIMHRSHLCPTRS
jgi:hypothetical protein